MFDEVDDDDEEEVDDEKLYVVLIFEYDFFELCLYENEVIELDGIELDDNDETVN